MCCWTDGLPWRKTVPGCDHGSRSHAPLKQNGGSWSRAKEVATKTGPTRLVGIDGRATMAFASFVSARQRRTIAVPSNCWDAHRKKTPMMRLGNPGDGLKRERQKIVDDPGAGILRVKLRERLVKDVRQVAEEQQCRAADGVRVQSE